VDDLLNGMVKMMATDSTITGPINLGNPNEFTIIELAKKVIEKTNSKSKLIFKPLQEDDPKQRKPDISMAKEILKWQPYIQLEEGLNKTVEYFDKLLKGELK